MTSSVPLHQNWKIIAVNHFEMLLRMTASFLGPAFLVSVISVASSSIPMTPNETTESNLHLSYVVPKCYPRGSAPSWSDCAGILHQQTKDLEDPTQRLSWSYQDGADRFLPASWATPGCIIGVKNRSPEIAQRVSFSLRAVADATTAILSDCDNRGYGGERGIGPRNRNFFVEVYKPLYVNSWPIGEGGTNVGKNSTDAL